jgi:hypothetical protein
MLTLLARETPATDPDDCQQCAPLARPAFATGCRSAGLSAVLTGEAVSKSVSKPGGADLSHARCSTEMTGGMGKDEG